MRSRSSTSVLLVVKLVPRQHWPQRLVPWVWFVSHTIFVMNSVSDFSNSHPKRSEKILPRLHLRGKVYG